MARIEHRSLSAVALLRGLSATALSSLERDCTWRKLVPEQRLINHDDTSDDVFFLAEGALRVIIYAPNGRAVLFRSMSPGDVIGEQSALDGKPRSASVEATTPAVVAQLGGAAFRALVAGEPSVALALLHQSIAYVRELSTRIYAFSSLAVIDRVHGELLRLGREAGPAGNQAIIDPAPRHVDIANRISTHREGVSRELSQLARMGLLERRGRALVLKDMAALERLANGPPG
jgi:CRP/FNR family transcriptional regulator, cyclic AMP receptor protein